ncbi:MAG: type II toxin-antitoxin system Phd/YefM family antitoxin [Kiritimatiellia bacterium]|jgi:antitoxin Phd
MKSWQLQEAKAKFSAVVNDAIKQGPQRVTRHGEEVVGSLSIKTYEELTRQSEEWKNKSLVEFFRDSPLAEMPPDAFQRDSDIGREVSL